MNDTKYNFCCDTMYEAIEENKIVDYDAVVRNYGILFRKNRIKMLSFCPWCGKKLPKNLTEDMYVIIEKEYGIPWIKADVFKYTNLPDEFKTDEWWKKRGL